MTFRIDWDEVERYQKLLGETPESERIKEPTTIKTIQEAVEEIDTKRQASTLFVTKKAIPGQPDTFEYAYVSPLTGISMSERAAGDREFEKYIRKIYPGAIISIRDGALNINTDLDII